MIFSLITTIYLVNDDKDVMASIKINKTKLSVSCFIANLKGF